MDAFRPKLKRVYEEVKKQRTVTGCLFGNFYQALGQVSNLEVLTRQANTSLQYSAADRTDCRRCFDLRLALALDYFKFIKNQLLFRPELIYGQLELQFSYGSLPTCCVFSYSFLQQLLCLYVCCSVTSDGQAALACLSCLYGCCTQHFRPFLSNQIV